MKSLPLAFLSLSLLFRHAQGLSSTYSACQLQKSNGGSALTGCPQGTLYVSATDRSANFNSVQKAIDSLPESGNAIILIGEGSYGEMIKVTRSAPITLLGQLNPGTASVSNKNSSQNNLVKIWNQLCAGNGYSVEATATLTVTSAANQNFGNVDFKVYNINFENNGCDSHSRALVTSLSYTNASFYGCTFASWQDTWYTGSGSNTYVVDSVIYGQTDYIFGCGISWFQSVVLANRGCGGGIAVWSGTSGTSAGVYIADSTIIRSPDVSASTITTGSCYLGRPWNAYAITVFLRNYMDDSIHPAGLTTWRGESSVPSTTYYAESGSNGPGGDTSKRVSQDHILSSADAERHTIEKVFSGNPSWIDFGYKY